jgi:hypothetical protein
MRPLSSLAFAFALVCSIALAPPASAVGAGPDAIVVSGARDAREARAVREALPVLELWLDHAGVYPRVERPLAGIALVDYGHVVAGADHRTVIGGTMRGAYDARTATIYLVRPWFGDSPEDLGVLLHELVHHRQVDAKHWYCERAMEWDAYKLQEAWLADHGLESGFAWAAILLGSSCAVRDHHPD